MGKSRGYTVAKVMEVPTSCRCGGDSAFTLDLGGMNIMLGCACHTWFDASTGQFVRRMDQPARPEGEKSLRYFYSQET